MSALSVFPSVKERVVAAERGLDQPRMLARFVGNPRNDMPQGLPFHLKQYLELVDITGRIVRDGKRGALDGSISPILDRLDIRPEYWLIMVTMFDSQFAPGTACMHYIPVNKSKFKCLEGGIYEIRRVARSFGHKRVPGLSNCKVVLG